MKVCFADNGCIYVIFHACRYVFISQKAYQETETRPESSVYTEMRGVAMLGDIVQDTTEYVRPSEVRDHTTNKLYINHIDQISFITSNIIKRLNHIFPARS